MVMHSDNEASPDLESGHYDLLKPGEDGLNSQPVLLYAPNKKRLARENGGWFVQWQEATMVLAQNKSLTLTDWRVIAVLQAKLDFDNWIRLSHAEIGQAIDVARPNISKSMQRLVGLNVVLIGPSTRNVKTYRLNPDLLFKGTMRNAVKARRQATRLTVVEGGRKKPDEGPVA